VREWARHGGMDKWTDRWQRGRACRAEDGLAAQSGLRSPGHRLPGLHAQPSQAPGCPAPLLWSLRNGSLGWKARVPGSFLTLCGHLLQERNQQPLSTEAPHLSVPASVIVSAPPPAQDPALANPTAKGAGLGPQAPDSQASPALAPQVVNPSSLCAQLDPASALLPTLLLALPCLLCLALSFVSHPHTS
jgi:hypothetical protein